MKTVGTGAAVLDLKFQIGSNRTLLFDFDVDISSWTFEFFIREYKGSRVKILSYTLANGGLNYPIYSDALQANFTSATTTINEGEYYWELRRTDHNVPLINGRAWFSFDAPEGDTEVPLTVTIGSQSVAVTVVNSGNPDTLPSVATLTSAATINISRTANVLASALSAITFTISYGGRYAEIILTLSATASTLTFPSNSLCVSEGIATGNNTLALSGVSGDKYFIAIENLGASYWVTAKNFGQ